MSLVSNNIDIFNFSSYKEFVVTWVSHQPRNGYGLYKQIAEHLGVGSVIVSQIFKGERNLTEEQAIELSEFLSLLELDKKYLIQLVRLQRAGSFKLKEHIQKELLSIKKEAGHLEKRIQVDFQLSEDKKAKFFSQWQYSALRLATDISKFQNLQALADFFDLEVKTVNQFMEFLLESQLCVRENGRYKMGPQIVYLEPSSPYTTSRHLSWRIKGIDQMEKNRSKDFFLTSPIVCSHKTAEKIRKRLADMVLEILEEVKPSKSETLTCLNVDWFYLDK